MTAPVLDASAVLALVRDEVGSGLVERHLDDALLASVNLAEVLAKHVDQDVDPRPVTGWLRALGVRIEPVTEADAQTQASIRALERAQLGSVALSLGDRLCLATAMRHDRPAMTADRAWAELDLPIEVTLIR